MFCWKTLFVITTDSTEKPDTSQTPQKQEQQPLVEDVTTTETPIITKLGDTEQLPLAETPVVVKLEPEEEDEHSRPRSRVARRPVKLTTACPNSPLRNFYTPVAEATYTARSSPICQQMAREAEGKVRIRPFSDSRGPAREDQVNSQSTDAADRERESAKSVSVKGTQLESMDGATSVPVPASVAQTEIVSDSLKPEDYHSTPQAVQLTDVEAHTEPSDSGQTSSDDALHHQATDHTPTPTLSTSAAVELTDQAQSAAATTLASGTESAPQLSTEPALEPSLASDPASLGLGASPVSSATSTPTLDMSQSPILQQPAPDISETIFLKVGSVEMINVTKIFTVSLALLINDSESTKSKDWHSLYGINPFWSLHFMINLFHSISAHRWTHPPPQMMGSVLTMWSL